MHTNSSTAVYTCTRVITRATDPRRHPHALDEHNMWSCPDPKRRFMLSVAFALQRGNADMFARCNARRTRNRSENVYSLRLPSPGSDSSISDSEP